MRPLKSSGQRFSSTGLRLTPLWPLAALLVVGAATLPAQAAQVQATPAKTAQAQTEQTQLQAGGAPNTYSATAFFNDVKAGQVTGLTLRSSTALTASWCCPPTPRR
jgi:hypothetical protein